MHEIPIFATFFLCTDCKVLFLSKSNPLVKDLLSNFLFLTDQCCEIWNFSYQYFGYLWFFPWCICCSWIDLFTFCYCFLDFFAILLLASSGSEVISNFLDSASSINSSGGMLWILFVFAHCPIIYCPIMLSMITKTNVIVSLFTVFFFKHLRSQFWWLWWRWFLVLDHLNYFLNISKLVGRYFHWFYLFQIDLLDVFFAFVQFLSWFGSSFE